MNKVPRFCRFCGGDLILDMTKPLPRPIEFDAYTGELIRKVCYTNKCINIDYRSWGHTDELWCVYLV